MRPYEKYVPSGVEWIRDIPEGWEVRKLKYLFSVFNGATPKSDNDDFWNGEIVWITPADYSTEDKYITKSNRMITEEGLNSCATRIAPVGSIIVSNRVPIGTVAIAATPLATSQGCKTLVRKNTLDERFIYYFLSTQSRNLNALGKGTTFLELSNSDLSCFFTPYPNFDIQQEIANYLDIETARIDCIIKAKGTLIERLKEKRTALITHAVTKGLDQNTKMKPSGIDWIGDIPAGWKVKKTKYLVGTKVTDGPHTTPDLVPDGIPFVSAEAVKNNRINLELIRGYISEEDHQEFCKKCKPQRDDIFMVKSGATTGNIAIVDFDTEFSIWSPLALIRSKQNEYEQKYVFYSMLSDFFVKQVTVSWSFGTQQNIGMGVIENLMIFAPPKEMQKKIADFLDVEVLRIDVMISKTVTSIEKLKEYRIALISACVTGKFNVRGV